MFKNFIKKLLHSLFELIIKLIGFKSLCWIVATFAFYYDKMTAIEWMCFTAAVIGTKFTKDLRGMYPKLNFLKGEK